MVSIATTWHGTLFILLVIELTCQPALLWYPIFPSQLSSACFDGFNSDIFLAGNIEGRHGNAIKFPLLVNGVKTGLLF